MASKSVGVAGMESLAAIRQRYIAALSQVRLNDVSFRRWQMPSNWGCVLDTSGEATLVRPLSGPVWIAPNDNREPFCVEAGDVVLFLDSSSPRLANDRSLMQNASDFPHSTVATAASDDGQVDLVIGRASRDASFVIAAAPPLVHVPATSQQEFPRLFAIADLLSLPSAQSDQMANVAITRRLTEALAIEMALYMLSLANEPHSWMAGFADRHIADALELLHSDTRTMWTVGLLATKVGVSRSVFAQRFHELVGVPPNRYLRQIRLHHAAWLLQDRQLSLGQISLMVGYLSEAAFNKAFLREFHVTPGRYRLQSSVGTSFDDQVS